MWINSIKNIKNINCGFIYPDGKVYGVDDYVRGEFTHEKILLHYNIKEEPGVIRFCSSFIMFESTHFLKHRYPELFIEIDYDILQITEQQSKLLRAWMSYQKGKISCPTCFDLEYQFRYLESLDDNMLSNIIMIK